MESGLREVCGEYELFSSFSVLKQRNGKNILLVFVIQLYGVLFLLETNVLTCDGVEITCDGAEIIGMSYEEVLCHLWQKIVYQFKRGLYIVVQKPGRSSSRVSFVFPPYIRIFEWRLLAPNLFAYLAVRRDYQQYIGSNPW